jgi:hypothetical protein
MLVVAHWTFPELKTYILRNRCGDVEKAQGSLEITVILRVAESKVAELRLVELPGPMPRGVVY